jgi:hypothetical protein
MKLTASAIIKPVISQYLASLSHMLDVAQKYCLDTGISEDTVLQSRLTEDMHPFIWQVQMVSEFSARCASRLAEIDVPEYAYEETSFDDLKIRIKKAIEYVNEIDDQALNDGLDRIQVVPMGPNKSVEFKGPIYLQHFFMPNFFFHVSTAYNILRHNQVPLGKLDFIGSMPS